MFKRRKLFVFTVLFDWVLKKWQKWNKFLKNGQTNISISELITKEGMEDFSPPPPASPYSVAYTNALWSLFKTFSHANVGHSSKKSLMLPTNPNRNSYAFCICWKPHKLPSTSQSWSWMTLKVRWWKEQIFQNSICPWQTLQILVLLQNFQPAEENSKSNVLLKGSENEGT